MADTQYRQGTVYREVGGAREVVSSGASLDIESGAELDIESGGALKLAGTSVTATAAEINQAADSSANVEVVTTTNVITAAESGATFFLNHTTGFVSTLPAPAAGLRFSFIVSTVPTSGNDTVVSNAGADVIQGAADVNSTRVLASNEDSINFVASTCLVGDRIDVISNGTSWFATGYSGATSGITFTVT